MFELSPKYTPIPDQKQATDKLAAGIVNQERFETLLGVTGSGKTLTMARVIASTNRPALVMSHNKTLAWQLYQEFKEFFPHNEVHYFVSYYDYYQPEAYLPSTDTYIEKDAKINETIDKLRHAATQAVLTRADTIIVSSVSCIYNIGDPDQYSKAALEIKKGQNISRQEFLRLLVKLYFSRNDVAQLPGTFSAKGEQVIVYLPTGDSFVKVNFYGKTIESIFHPQLGEIQKYTLFPAKHFVTPEKKVDKAIENIRKELQERLYSLRKGGKILEAARLEQRTNYDIEMLKETGYVSGIENYSRHLSFRQAGEAPLTLFDFFGSKYGNKFLVFVDESHMSIPQVRGMYHGDKARKEVLVEHGFRLPSALDNRPLTFDEWISRLPQTIFVSATPGSYELNCSSQVVEQLLRPTHIVDPKIEVRPTQDQVSDLIAEIKKRIQKKERVLATVITKRLAEDLSERLAQEKIKAAYLHSEIRTLERPEVLNDLRRGEIDVLVGVNLLREGLDLPEVSLVAILDADKEGFLRNETTLIQTMGRAARHPDGIVIMYADTVTRSMKNAIKETGRRRVYQESYNKKHGLKPKPIKKKVMPKKQEYKPELQWLKELSKKQLEKRMEQAAKDWDFETAILIRDYLENS